MNAAHPHTLALMSSVAAAADAPEEFAALADDAIDDFMSEAASDVEVFATTEGHRDVGAVQHVAAVQVQRPELDVQLRQRGPAAAEALSASCSALS